jgi:hypothetical protein
MECKLKMNVRFGHTAVVLSLFVCLLPAITIPAQNPEPNSEQPVRMKDLPQPVQVTVREQSKGAVIRGLSKEIDKGQTIYEVSLRVKGQNKDISIDPSGTVVEVETQVPLASLPPAAREAIVKQAGKGRILLVESIAKNNAIVAYEAHVRTAGKISEIKVDPDGKPYADVQK